MTRVVALRPVLLYVKETGNRVLDRSFPSPTSGGYRSRAPSTGHRVQRRASRRPRVALRTLGGLERHPEARLPRRKRHGCLPASQGPGHVRRDSRPTRTCGRGRLGRGAPERGRSAIQTHTWDGDWSVRAFRENGTVIGTDQTRRDSIFLNAQTWPCFGRGAPEQGIRAMDACHDRLATEYGLMLCEPPYIKTPCQEIRAVLFNPGMKENAGFFVIPRAGPSSPRPSSAEVTGPMPITGVHVLRAVQRARGGCEIERLRALPIHPRKVQPQVRCIKAHLAQGTARGPTSRAPSTSSASSPSGTASAWIR